MGTSSIYKEREVFFSLLFVCVVAIFNFNMLEITHSTRYSLVSYCRNNKKNIYIDISNSDEFVALKKNNLKDKLKE